MRGTNFFLAILLLALVPLNPVFAAAARVIDVRVTVAGYEPETIHVEPREHVVLRVTRVTDATCATEIIVPDFKVNKPLPLNQPILIDLAPMPEGEHVFGCAMSLMIKGTLVVGNPPVKKPYEPPPRPKPAKRSKKTH